MSQSLINKIVRNILILLILLKIHRLIQFFRKGKVPILLYHGISNNKNSKHLYINSFDKQIKYLASHFKIITLENLREYIEKNKKIPKNSLIITFDDGYENNYLFAHPILKKNNCPASIFLTTGLIGTNKFIWYDELEFIIFKNIEQGIDTKIVVDGTNYKITSKDDFFKIKGKIKKNNLYDSSLLNQFMHVKKQKPSEQELIDYRLLNLKQINLMKKEGVTFYPHGHNHNILSKLNDSQLKTEINKSISFINKNKINKNINFFAYPNGKLYDYDDRVKKILNENNVKYALTDQMDYFNKLQEPYEIKRISMGETDDFYSFLIRVYFKLFL